MSKADKFIHVWRHLRTSPVPVHSSDGIEPPEPASPGQVTPDPDCLQVFKGLQIRPEMLKNR